MHSVKNPEDLLAKILDISTKTHLSKNIRFDCEADFSFSQIIDVLTLLSVVAYSKLSNLGFTRTIFCLASPFPH